MTSDEASSRMKRTRISAFLKAMKRKPSKMSLNRTVSRERTGAPASALGTGEGALGGMRRGNDEEHSDGHQGRLKPKAPPDAPEGDGGAPERGPAYLGDVLSEAVQRDRVHQPVRGNHRRDERLPYRLPHRDANTCEQGHHHGHPHRHHVHPDQDGCQQGRGQHQELADEEQHAPVPAVGEHPYREREKEHRHAQREAHRPQEKVPGQQCFNDQPGEGEAQDALHERVAEVVQPEQPEVAYAEGRERLQAKATPSQPCGTGPRATLLDPCQSPTSASAASVLTFSRTSTYARRGPPATAPRPQQVPFPSLSTL